MHRRDVLKLLGGLPAVASVRTLTAEPGSIVVITFPGSISCETAKRLKEHAERAFQDTGYRFLVLGDGAKVSLIRRREAYAKGLLEQ